MERNHTVSAVAAVILALSAVLCSPAAADMGLVAIDDPVETGSWSQTFGTRAGNWTEFDMIKIVITGQSFNNDPPPGQVTPPLLPPLQNFKVGYAKNDASTRLNQYYTPQGGPQNANWALLNWDNIGGEYTAEASGDPISGSLTGAELNLSSHLDAHFGKYLIFTANFADTQYDFVDLAVTLYNNGQATWFHELNNQGGNWQQVKSFPCSEPIPAPAAIGLGMLGLGLVGWYMRRFA